MLDSLTVVIAAVALVLSIVALLTQWHGDRRRLFLELSDRLVHVDMQRGRRELHRLGADVDLRRLRDDDPDRYDLINRTLAELEVTAFLVSKRYVSYRLVEEFWGRVVLQTVASAARFIEHRDAEARRVIWPNLIALHDRIRDRGRFEQSPRSPTNG